MGIIRYIACILLWIGYSVDADNQSRYGIIISASICSQASVFAWNSDISVVNGTIITPALIAQSPSQCPGLRDLLYNTSLVRNHINDVVAESRQLLPSQSHLYQQWPIYFQASGEFRQLNSTMQFTLVRLVQECLAESTFYFEPSFARILSGEEEGGFAWASVNYLIGTLEVSNNPVSDDALQKVAVIDMNTVSTQISFVPLLSNSIMESKFYYQIGMRKWELYSKSYLQFGYQSARLRYTQRVSDTSVARLTPGSAEVPFYISYCLFAGYSEIALAPQYPGATVRLTGPPVPAQDQFDRCISELIPIMDEFGGNYSYCMDMYQNQCGINGAFQPNLTNSISGDRLAIVGINGMTLPWIILRLPSTADLGEYRVAAESLCSLTFLEAIQYELSAMLMYNPILAHQVPNYCFLVSYLYVLLTTGYHLPPDQEMTVRPVSGVLGAMLSNVNSLSPLPLASRVSRWRVLAVIIAVIIIGASALYIWRTKIYLRLCRKQATVVESTDPYASFPSQSSFVTRDADLTQRWDVSGVLPFGRRSYNYECIPDSQETLVS